MKKDANQIITNKIIKLIENQQAGGFNWQSGFKSLGNGLPSNAETKRPYTGLNSFYLMLLGASECATYAQWKKLGYQVQKGSKSTTLIRPVFIKDKETLEDKLVSWSSFNVFLSSDVLNSETKETYPVNTTEHVDNIKPIKKAEMFIGGINHNMEINTSGRAFYMPSRDLVSIPARESFTGTDTSTATECYYSTYLHELAHWTGHETRLDRLKSGGFASQSYAYEELVAELTACFLCCDLGITNEPRVDHAKYLGSWLKALKNDKKLIGKAAGLAQKAFTYLKKESLQDTKPTRKVA